MDLLGSILGSMEKPPENIERKKAKEQKLQLEKLQQQEKQKLSQFRTKIQVRIGEFIKDSNLKSVKFEPMDKTLRAITHEVADVAGLISFSFGQDEIDRYVMLWKKEYAPCDEELFAYRNDQVYDPEKAALKAACTPEVPVTCSKRKHTDEHLPNSYQQKYEHILGKASTAQLTSCNRSYGDVPSENKRDHRTIEQVMAENRAKKRQKIEKEQSAASAAAGTVTDSTVISTHEPNDKPDTASGTQT